MVTLGAKFASPTASFLHLCLSLFGILQTTEKTEVASVVCKFVIIGASCQPVGVQNWIMGV